MERSWSNQSLTRDSTCFGFRDRAADELDYLLLSGSDRIGALDFQARASEYVPRESNHPTLDDLLQAAEMLESNRPLPPELERALLRGTSIGGARPKALIDNDGKHFIAKFGSTTDAYPVVKTEYIGMRLAALAGLATAKVALASSLGKDVLMIERFDRIDTPTGKARRLMLSGLSLLELNEKSPTVDVLIQLCEAMGASAGGMVSRVEEG